MLLPTHRLFSFTVLVSVGNVDQRAWLVDDWRVASRFGCDRCQRVQPDTRQAGPEETSDSYQTPTACHSSTSLSSHAASLLVSALVSS